MLKSESRISNDAELNDAIDAINRTWKENGDLALTGEEATDIVKGRFCALQWWVLTHEYRLICWSSANEISINRSLRGAPIDCSGKILISRLLWSRPPDSFDLYYCGAGLGTVSGKTERTWNHVIDETRTCAVMNHAVGYHPLPGILVGSKPTNPKAKRVHPTLRSREELLAMCLTRIIH